MQASSSGAIVASGRAGSVASTSLQGMAQAGTSSTRTAAVFMAGKSSRISAKRARRSLSHISTLVSESCKP